MLTYPAPNSLLLSKRLLGSPGWHKERNSANTSSSVSLSLVGSFLRTRTGDSAGLGALGGTNPSLGSTVSLDIASSRAWSTPSATTFA